MHTEAFLQWKESEDAKKQDEAEFKEWDQRAQYRNALVKSINVHL